MARFIPRLYLDLAISANTKITLSAQHSHYLCNVMRKKAGDHLLLFNADGEFNAEIAVAHKTSCQCNVLEQARQSQAQKRLSLYFSPVKQHTEFIIQKATELGVSDIYPVIFDHTLITKINAEKLQKIAIEASEQSERLTVPTLHPVCKFIDLIKSPGEQIFVCSEKRDNVHLLTQLDHGAESYAVMIGAEGGFSENEFNRMSACSRLTPATLSKNILRSDTAVITALACCQVVI